VVEGRSSLKAILNKRHLLAKIGEEIGQEGMKKAEENPHSWRRPRPCGLTIHPGLGCPNACLYCYVGDVLGTGPIEPRPLRLSGPELSYALLLNPYFVPGRMGTFLAFGAICDPFHPTLMGKTLDVMASVASFLGNPMQFSTKMALGPELIEKLPGEVPMCPLITITTFEKASELEPRAPSPWERLKTISELRKAGFKPMLFLRPLLPGLIEREVDAILLEAKRAGAVGVVVGALRVNKAILHRLKRFGLYEAIIRRLKKYRTPLLSHKALITVPSSDLKKLVLETAGEVGLVGFRAACCANAFVAGVPCTGLCWLKGFCSKCPNRCMEKLPDVQEEDIRKVLRIAFGLSAQVIRLERFKLFIRLKRPFASEILPAVKTVLEVATRRSVILRT